MMITVLMGAALAGDGPWTLSPGDQSLYLGGSYSRYGSFEGGSGVLEPLGEGITAAGLVGVYTGGLAEGLEAELVLPYESVRVNAETMPVCMRENVPRDFCRSTSGVGDISAVLKWRLINELWRSPVSLAVAGGVRSGETYAAQRDRLTTLGDGQTDVGVGLSLGRTDLVGNGWYRVGAWGWYWYRFANAEVGGQKIPADEVSYTLEATVSPHPRCGFGPAVQGFHRLGGIELEDASIGSVDAWSSLRASQIQVGGKLGIYAVDGPTLSFAVLRTVYAQNNPSDTLVISIGVGWFRPGAVPG